MERIIPLNTRERGCKRDVGTKSETHVHIGSGRRSEGVGGGGVEGGGGGRVGVKP